MNNLKVYEKEDVRVIHEEFDSINSLLNTLSSRPKNKIMKDADSSESGTYSFTNTNSYSEAESLLVSGYSGILDKIKLGIKQASKSLLDYEVPKSTIIEDVQGATPIVPNYLSGIPKSMTFRKQLPKKIKTINLVYSPNENCSTSAEDFIKAGVAILSAIRVIEKNNISIKLDCMFTDTYNSKEVIVSTVKVKDYKDRLDLQKLCFPLAHPSMERRIGFKYIETVPEMSQKGFHYGYGRTTDLKELDKWINLPKNSVLLTLRQINHDLNNDPKEVINYINSKINGK